VSEPYLILHKVRGLPAFDVAEQMPCAVCHAVQETVDFTVPDTEDCEECSSSGFWWIIPTSGHRAYPYHHLVAEEAAIALNELRQDGTDWLITGEWADWVARVMIAPNPDWPDHYPHSTSSYPHSTSSKPFSVRNLLTALGLTKPIKKRKF
jgi:hypothetical protein